MQSKSDSVPRLIRLDWLFTQYPVYFLTACVLNRQPLLANQKAHDSFVEFARRATEHGVWVGRYVLMPDHLHLFAAFGPAAPPLSEWMKGLKHSVSKLGIRWQKGFFDHVLRSSESYQQKWDYVLQNPVRAELVRDSRDWPYQGEVNPLEFRAEEKNRR
jgi:REP-associated tyrosine transposase